MSQIFEYIKSLDWASNWVLYTFTSIMIVWLSLLTIKLLFNKLTYLVKKIIIISLMLLIGSILSYMLFLIGIIEFDILSLIGLSQASNSIQDFIIGIQEWFRNIFAIGA